MKIAELAGLGPASEKRLKKVGINTAEELRELGALEAFMRLYQQEAKRPSLNMLYALVGAMENRHWAEIAQTEKYQLLMQLDGYREFKALLESD